MDAQQAVRFIDRLLDRQQQRKLNDLESTIVLGIWEGSTYKSIGDRLSYETDYIKHVAARLWKLLSKLLGESICKGNIQSALERYHATIAVAGWYEPVETDIDDRIKTDLKISKTLMISDRSHSIVSLVSINRLRTEVNESVSSAVTDCFGYVQQQPTVGVDEIGSVKPKKHL